MSNRQNGSLGVTSDITPPVVKDLGDAGAVFGAIGLLLKPRTKHREATFQFLMRREAEL
jgi:hypothetical protein